MQGVEETIISDEDPPSIKSVLPQLTCIHNIKKTFIELLKCHSAPYSTTNPYMVSTSVQKSGVSLKICIGGKSLPCLAVAIRLDLKQANWVLSFLAMSEEVNVTVLLSQRTI
ncbi:hypothetical protein VCR15J5_730085 [Vibrio crassostreae]|nr:hypothetical protein VCR15J5_730085 [Vibrio crassostreae]